MARGDFPSAKQDQYMVRFPDGMRERIAAEAKAGGRSVNAEIVARLSNDIKTPRDEFAMAALIGLLSQSGVTAMSSTPELGAEYCYRMADAMMAARKNGKAGSV